MIRVTGSGALCRPRRDDAKDATASRLSEAGIERTQAKPKSDPRQSQSPLQHVLAPPLERPELRHGAGAVARHHAPRHVVATPNAEKTARGILEAAPACAATARRRPARRERGRQRARVAPPRRLCPCTGVWRTRCDRRAARASPRLCGARLDPKHRFTGGAAFVGSEA